MGRQTDAPMTIVRHLTRDKCGGRLPKDQLYAVPSDRNYHVVLDGSLVLRRALGAKLKRLTEEEPSGRGATLGDAFRALFREEVVDRYMGAGGTPSQPKHVTWRIDYPSGGIPVLPKAPLQYMRYRDRRVFDVAQLAPAISSATTFPIRLAGDADAPGVELDDLWGSMDARMEMFLVMCEVVAELELPEHSILDFAGWLVRDAASGKPAMADGIFRVRRDRFEKHVRGLLPWRLYFRGCVHTTEPCHEAEGDPAVVALAARWWLEDGRPVIIESSDFDVFEVALSLAARWFALHGNSRPCPPLHIVRHLPPWFTDWWDVVAGFRLLQAHMAMAITAPPRHVEDRTLPDPAAVHGALYPAAPGALGIHAAHPAVLPDALRAAHFHEDPVLTLLALLMWSGNDMLRPTAEIRFSEAAHALVDGGSSFDSVTEQLGDGNYGEIFASHPFPLWWEEWFAHRRDIGPLVLAAPVNSANVFAPRVVAVNMPAVREWWVRVSRRRGVVLDKDLGKGLKHARKRSFIQPTTWDDVRAMAHRWCWSIAYYWNGFAIGKARATGVEELAGRSLYGWCRETHRDIHGAERTIVAPTQNVVPLDLVFSDPDMNKVPA